MIIDTEEKGFARDVSSNALINTDRRALEQYRASKQKIEKVDALERKVEQMQDDISEIKELLQLLVK